MRNAPGSTTTTTAAGARQQDAHDYGWIPAFAISAPIVAALVGFVLAWLSRSNRAAPAAAPGLQAATPAWFLQVNEMGQAVLLIAAWLTAIALILTLLFTLVLVAFGKVRSSVQASMSTPDGSGLLLIVFLMGFGFLLVLGILMANVAVSGMAVGDDHFEYRWAADAAEISGLINSEGWRIVPGQPSVNYLRRPRPAAVPTARPATSPGPSPGVTGTPTPTSTQTPNPTSVPTQTPPPTATPEPTQPPTASPAPTPG